MWLHPGGKQTEKTGNKNDDEEFKSKYLIPIRYIDTSSQKAF